MVSAIQQYESASLLEKTFFNTILKIKSCHKKKSYQGGEAREWKQKGNEGSFAVNFKVLQKLSSWKN